jgi:translation initiation factor eIF-2B subunit epsilon
MYTTTRTCKIGNNTLIGSYTQVYDKAQIISSVIGQRCIIASGAVVRNSYIFDGTIIGAGSVIDQSIVGAGVRIGEKGTLAKGCLVADGVILGPGAKLSPYDRVSVGPGNRGPSSQAQLSGEDGEDVDSELEDFEFGMAFPVFFFSGG